MAIGVRAKASATDVPRRTRLVVVVASARATNGSWLASATQTPASGDRGRERGELLGGTVEREVDRQAGHPPILPGGDQVPVRSRRADWRGPARGGPSEVS
ncbi:hypothetical protein GCM10009815_08660 [Nocardioides marmoribigeumensis]